VQGRADVVGQEGRGGDGGRVAGCYVGGRGWEVGVAGGVVVVDYKGDGGGVWD
jgi:hypothetical protein